MNATNPIRWWAVGLVLLALTADTRADWDPGGPYKMHHPQLPDLLGGLDVLDGPYFTDTAGVKVLANDWKCSETGPVTGIHVWGSYNDDFRPVPGPNVMFNVAIYDDVPAVVSPTGYSMPGNLLWQAYVKPTAERVYADDLTEPFYDPNQKAIIGDDQTCWQYNFRFDEATAFRQQEGTIYWLSVSHTPDVSGDGIVMIDDFMLPAAGWAYGWKTADHRWNDTGVWIDVDWQVLFPQDAVPPSGSTWNLLAVPMGELALPLDLAFVITPEPATLALMGLGVAGLLARRRRV